MLREQYERIVYECCKRVSFLSDVLDFAGRHRHEEDLKGVRIFLVRELRRIRRRLWSVRESADAELINRAIDSIEVSELHLRRKDYASAWTGVNAAYGFLSRISVNLFDVKKELRHMEREILLKGMIIGGIAGFFIGLVLYVLTLILYYLR